MPGLLSLSEEHRLSLLVGAVTDYAIFLLDPTGLVATWNAGAQRFKGYKADEIVGQHFSRFYTEEDAAADMPARALRIAAREGRFEDEGWRLRKDGTRFWAHVVLDAIRDEKGVLLGFAKVTRDITAKREREQELFASEQRFRLLVEGVRDYAIYMLDTDGRITNWNAGAEAIKGYSANEIVGQNFSVFYTEEDRNSGEPQRALATALSEGKYEREAQRVRKDGSLFWAHVVLDPIFDDEGTHIGFAKITRDVTEPRRAQEELESTREALAQSQKLQAIGELTGGIAHDFNNLLTVIAGAGDFLLRNSHLSHDKQRRYLEAIVETTGRATALTNQLLAFGRRQRLVPEVMDINLRIDAFAEMVGRILGSPIKLTVRLEADPAMVEADVTQLETALLNAIINARDAMPDGGEVTISTFNCELEGGTAVCLSVADTGHGIPKADIGRVFEPFFTTKEIGKGTGLGLSQIHGFAAQAGGRAEIDSTEGQGTTVRILLPATAKAVAEASEDEASVDLPSGLRILVVEDNPHVRAFATQLLGDLDCNVVAVEGGPEALDMLANERFDLVFSDVVMPRMSGIALARAVERDHPDVPVLLATGYSEELLGVKSKQQAVLLKPYNATSLGRAISQRLAAREGKAA